jgi:hypothetical protein
MKIKLLAAMALVTTSFTPMALAPAMAQLQEGAGTIVGCTSTNSNIEFRTADLEVRGGGGTTYGSAYQAGTSGNWFVLATVTSGDTYNVCRAWNTNSDNRAPGQDDEFLVSYGTTDTYEVKVCQNVGRTDSELVVGNEAGYSGPCTR